jgi:DNA-directed RNA polymerase specialized sigma subunit
VDGKTEQSIEALWKKYFDDRGDTGTKNEILTHYLYLVIGVVKRMMPQFGDFGGKSCCDRDDLINSGVLVLIDAVG